ncbi:hypothetical protein FOFC_07708 [Fusarium oxysporum]|nr:hypothetical protein FOFC_07708 [Fusarium oxysporum]
MKMANSCPFRRSSTSIGPTSHLSTPFSCAYGSTACKSVLAKCPHRGTPCRRLGRSTPFSHVVLAYTTSARWTDSP